MVSPGKFRTWICAVILRVLFALTIVSTAVVQAQTFNVIYSFTGGSDGANPYAGLTIDAAGNLYGTAFAGGLGYGTIFTLKPSDSGWAFSTMYQFQGGSDGAGPVARVIFGPNGSLYGSTAAGGQGACLSGGYTGCGTVFNLQNSVGVCRAVHCGLAETVLYRFRGSDGSYPQGDLTFDQAGGIYGTAVNGGAGFGIVYELTSSNGRWTQNVLYKPQLNSDGSYPWGGVAFDSSGNLYGVLAHNGLTGYGSVYQLAWSGSSWIKTDLHGFTYGNDGAIPQGGLIMDSSGKIYGTTVNGGSGWGGTVWELSPSGDSWSYRVLHALSGGIDLGPYDKLAMDSSGNLYGTTYADGPYDSGTVFKLSYSNGSWSYTLLHNFTGGNDGGNPFSTLSLDSQGNLYGTTSRGGSRQAGVVFKITP